MSTINLGYEFQGWGDEFRKVVTFSVTYLGDSLLVERDGIREEVSSLADLLPRGGTRIQIGNLCHDPRMNYLEFLDGTWNVFTTDEDLLSLNPHFLLMEEWTDENGNVYAERWGLPGMGLSYFHHHGAGYESILE